MTRIRNSDLVVKLAGRWDPSDIAFIRVVYFQAAERDTPAALQLECILERRDQASHGWPSLDKPQYRVGIRCVGVSSLRIKDIGYDGVQVMGFAINDVSSHGLEHVAYEVIDYEGDRIWCGCGDIEITEVSAIRR